ncbi:hypothetical protein ACEPAH_7974 [Sanghuangporus vaninii]
MPVTVITAVPAFISKEEHAQLTAATPSSFSDILPVLRHKQENVRAVFDPPVPDLSEDELKQGTVYILESALVFISESSGRGFQIDYPSIILHAISRSEPPSLYCQLGEPASADVSEVEDEEEATELRELNIYPEDTSSISTLFETLSACASLHPDPTDSDDDMGEDDEDDDGAFVDADVEAVQAIAREGVDGEPELTEAGRAALDRLESLIQDNYRNQTMVNGRSDHSTIGTIGQDTEEGQFADAASTS